MWKGSIGTRKQQTVVADQAIYQQDVKIYRSTLPKKYEELGSAIVYLRKGFIFTHVAPLTPSDRWDIKMKELCLQLGGNAVIGLRFSELGVTGTIVVVEEW